LQCEFPDEETLYIEEDEPLWKIYFDGASSIRPTPGDQIPKVRAGVVWYLLLQQGEFFDILSL
jgi:hypothetical protein